MGKSIIFLYFPFFSDRTILAPRIKKQEHVQIIEENHEKSYYETRDIYY